MASYWQKLILTALILAITIPISTGHKRRRTKRRSHHHHSDSDDSEKYIRDLCSETERSEVCWNILKPELGRFDDKRDIGRGVIELARGRSKEIRDQLSRYRRDSNDERLQKKYYLCSQNYNDVERDLGEALRKLSSHDYHKIWDQIEDAEDELEECTREFGRGSFDPAHVGDRNDELRVYLDIVRAAADRLEYRHHHHHDRH